MGNRVNVTCENDIFIVQLVSLPQNPTDQLFFKEMVDVMGTLGSCQPRKGVIICGLGNHFSSGADIDELMETLGRSERSLQQTRDRSLHIFEKIAGMPVPVVAAIQGCCLGSGLELALACHYRIATRTALFSFPETEFGLLPGCGGSYRLPRLIGLARSIEMILGGRKYLGEEALDIGLVDRVVTKGELMLTAHTAIKRLAGN